MNTFDLSLDLDKRAGVTQWVTMRQGDHDGTQLRATIYDHGTQVSDSYTCRVSIRKPTDNEYYRETCSFSGGVAIVTIDEQYAASEVGITYGYFELLQGTAVIASTESFSVRILQSAIDGAIVAPPYDSAIEDALAELDEATGRISQMVQDATAEYLEAHPEITTTVQDNSITDAKLIQKGGILSREQWLETMLPNIPRKTTAEADVHSVTDSAGGGPLGIKVYGRSTQDGTPTPDAPVEIQSVSPNLLDPSTFMARGGGVDTIEDGFVSDSTPTSDTSGWSWAHRTFDVTLPAGMYTVCFCVRKAAGTSATYAVMTSSDTVIKSAGNRFEPYTFTLAEATTIGIKIKTYDVIVACMVVEGTVTENPAEYIPYGGITLATVGRNLVDVPDLTRTMSNTYFIEGSKSSGIVMNTCRLEAGQTYTLSMDITSSVEPFLVSVGAGTGAYSMDVVASGEKRNGHVTVTFTPTAASLARGDVFAFRAPRYSSPTTATYSISNFQLEKGASDHAYEPYAPVTIPIDLGGRSLRSLPDGTRDEVNVDEWGHAVLTQRVDSVDLGTLTWFYEADNHCFGSSVLPNAFSSMSRTQVVCDSYTYASSGTADNTAFLYNRFIYVYDSDYTDAAAFKAAVSGAELIYPLATPQTIDLGYLDPALLPAPDLTAYVVPSAPSVLRYGFDVAAAIAEIATA